MAGTCEHPKTRIPLGQLAAIDVDEYRTLILGGRRILLFRDRDGNLVAVDDHCRKRGVPLTRREDGLRDSHHPICGCAVVQDQSEWAQARQCRCSNRHAVVTGPDGVHLLLPGN